MTDAEAPEPPPLIAATGLGLRTRRGWVFRDVDLALAAGSVTALAGPAGSGRSMLLLTIAGRARPSAGTLTVAGHDRRAEIRRSVAVARITAAVELEPELRVTDHVREASLLAHGHFDARWARDLVGSAADSVTLAGDLAADESVLLSVALAMATKPAVLVVDDVDHDASAEQQTRIWRALRTAADTGTTVVATTVDTETAAGAGAGIVGMEAVDARD
jgi:ABC-type multidrug transport system ATPase subunit